MIVNIKAVGEPTIKDSRQRVNKSIFLLKGYCV